MQKEKMSMMGIGNILLPLTIIYLIGTFVINYFFKPIFFIKELPLPIAVCLGVIFLAIGIPYYIITAKTMFIAYTEGVLCTTGVYATCRNPLYADWIFFLIPGIVIFFRSWLLLTTPVFMYIVFIILIWKEEKYLQNTFKDKYLEYKNNTNLIFPKLWKIFKKY